MKPANLFLFLVLVFSFFQCESEDYTIDKKKQLYIDTFSARLIKDMSADLDSLCKLNQEAYIKEAVDSILIARKKEIEKMLKN